MAEKAGLLNQIQQHQMAVEQMKKTEADKFRDESLRKSHEKLLEVLPEWRDQAKRTAEQQEIANLLIASGYSSDELNDLTDWRAVQIARKAMLWDKAQAVKAKQVKPDQ